MKYSILCLLALTACGQAPTTAELQAGAASAASALAISSVVNQAPAQLRGTFRWTGNRCRNVVTGPNVVENWVFTDAALTTTQALCGLPSSMVTQSLVAYGATSLGMQPIRKPSYTCPSSIADNAGVLAHYDFRVTNDPTTGVINHLEIDAGTCGPGVPYTYTFDRL